MRPEPLPDRPFHATIHACRAYNVEVGLFDHGIPVLGVALNETEHLSVNKDKLDRAGLKPGPWLRDLKMAVRRRRPEETPVEAIAEDGTPRTFTSGELAAEAQYGLAVAHERAGSRELAIREHTAFLERFPGHRRAPAARERIEYLTQFAIVDPQGLNRALQQALIDELSGRPRRRVLLELSRALRVHQDFANAVRAYEMAVPHIDNHSETFRQVSYGLVRSLAMQRLPARARQAIRVGSRHCRHQPL